MSFSRPRTGSHFHLTGLQPISRKPVDQVKHFCMEDKNSDREDVASDAFCYGIAIALDNIEGF
jgi:hypothetical protein